MNKLNKLFMAACVVAIAACSRQGAQDQPSAHGDEHGGGISITHYVEATELFVEFPRLVKGGEAAFAAHMTRLPDFKAVSEGRLTVTLSGGGQPEESAEIGISDTPGIFRPVLKPQYPGKRRLVFQLAVSGLTAVHDLGEIKVYPDRDEAKVADAEAKAAVGEEGIKFTKEQQWKIDFANTTAVEREVRESIAVTATLRPRASGEAQIAAPTAGLLRLADRFPQVGMKVAAGQVLAYLAPRLGGETDAATLSLAVQRARIETNQASQERERLEGLLAIEAVPAKRVVEARNRERLVQAELKAAEQRAATYQGGAGGIALKSPIAGTVVAVNASPGAAVAEGQMVVHVAALDRLWLEARVPESELGRITAPTGAFFRLDGTQSATALEVGRNARLIAFGGLVDKDTRTVPVILEFENPGAVLRAGMHVQTRLYTGRSARGVAIPASALVDDAGQTVVFVQKEGESFERRIVELGPRDGDWVAIKSGVLAGERVVTKGAYQIRLAATQPAAMGHGHAH